MVYIYVLNRSNYISSSIVFICHNASATCSLLLYHFLEKVWNIQDFRNGVFMFDKDEYIYASDKHKLKYNA